MSTRRIVLIAPCRDEARHMRRTLEAIERQTLPPEQVVVVDDGSKDDTPRILAEYAARLPYLKVVRREDRGVRAVGPGVIEAFYAGLDTVNLGRLRVPLQARPRPRPAAQVLPDPHRADGGRPAPGTCSGKPYFPHPDTGALHQRGLRR